MNGAPLTDAIAGIDGVTDATSQTFVTTFLVSPLDPSELLLDQNPFVGDARYMGARLIEGRFADPDSPNEFTVGSTFATYLREHFGTKVGDHFQTSSYDHRQADNNLFGEEPAVPRFEVTLVGVTESPSEFDDPYPAMTFPISFIAAHPTIGVVRSTIAVHLAPGTDAGAVMASVRALPGGAEVQFFPARVVSNDARRVVRFQVNALWVVAAVVLLAAVIAIFKIVGRALRLGDEEWQAMTALGWRERDIAVERAVLGGLVAAAAAPVALLVGASTTRLFPLGALDTFEPDPGVRIDWSVALVGVALMAVVAVAAAALSSRRRSGARAARPAPFVRWLGASGAGLPLVAGARMMGSNRRGERRFVTSLVAGAGGVATMVAAVVIGVSLTHLADSPARYGVNYDQLFGNPYVPVDGDIVTPIVPSNDVSAVTGATFGSLSLDGHDTPVFAFNAAKGDMTPVVLEGRTPAAADEIGLGAETARRIGADLGDTIEAVASDGGSRQLDVVGIVVTPDVAGDGSAMTFDGYAALNPFATQNALLVRFSDTAVPNAAQIITETNYSPPGALNAPTSVRALDRMAAAPKVLAITLAALLVLACGFLLTTSVRNRRHELAVLSALGATPGQLRGIVHWQATLVAIAGLAVGVPLGLLAGRSIVTALNEAVGVVPGTTYPALLLIGIPVAGLVATNLLAVLPAHRATGIHTRLLSDG